MRFGVGAFANAATKATGPAFSKQGRRLVTYDARAWTNSPRRKCRRSCTQHRSCGGKAAQLP